MRHCSTPKILQKNIRYPTYQLSAIAASVKETPENQLVICALSVLEWVRAKFKEFEIPSEFKAPAPEEYSEVAIKDLKSAYINEGYSVETICIPNEKLWAFRLIEPDLSTRWLDGSEVSTAVPGRIFETNIAFQVSDNLLHCGVNLIVSEPENVERQAIVLRPSVVSILAHNPKIGLKAGFPLEERLWELNSREAHKQLRNCLKNWMIPAVIFCDFAEDEAKPPVMPSSLLKNGFAPVSISASPDIIPGAANRLSTPTYSGKVPGNIPLHMQPPKKKHNDPVPMISQVCKKKPYIPYDTELFSRSRMGYVHCFHLPASQFDAFSNSFHLQVKNGEVLFLEPEELGGGILRYPYTPEKKEENFSELMGTSRDYLRKKPVKFNRVRFLTAAKQLLESQYLTASGTAEETAESYREQIKLLQEEHKNTLMDKNDKIQSQAAKLTRLKNMLEEVDLEKERIRKAADGEISAMRQHMIRQEQQLEYFMSLPQRPRSPQEVPEWVEKRFAGRLIFHQRAIRLIEAVPPKAIDMALLCDAIEYLAQEYRDTKAGLLSKEDSIQRCAEKYGRPFEVTPNSDTSISMYASQYKVKYNLGFKGKPIETVLEEHLKVGNTAGNLIRIYFFYDSDKQLIVVGSLPNHLKVAQIQN